LAVNRIYVLDMNLSHLPIVNLVWDPKNVRGFLNINPYPANVENMVSS